MEITEAIKHAIDGNAILFLGAGFSCGGENANRETMASASELSLRLCKEMGASESTELAIVSDMFIDHKIYGKGITALISFLKKQCLCIKPTEAQKIIINLPWRRIYTTNYDNIPEICSRKENIERETITATLSKKNVSSANGAIVHINGYIQGVTEEKFYDEFKITNSNYLKAGFLDSIWGAQFIRDINTSKAIIFVGYSMKYDLELQRVMNGAIKEKAVFIDCCDLSEEQEYLLGKWGELYPIEVNGLAEEIRNISKNYCAPKIVRKLESFEELQIDEYDIGNVTPNDVINLLVYGKCNKYDFRKENYYIEREELLQNVKKILREHKICLIHSNLGNGKSIAQFYLASRLIEDYRVYMVNNLENIQEDIEILKQRKSFENLIIVDDYDMQMDLFKELSYDFPDNIKVIASSRTSLSELLVDSLITSYGIPYDDIGILNIEIITDQERKLLIKLLDEYNLWGNKSGYTEKEKEKLIFEKYRNRLSSIFYMLLDSNVISEKVGSVIYATNNKEVKKYLFAQAICDICNFKLKGYEIAYIAGIDYSEIEKALSNEDSKEMFMRSSDDIELRSSIFSQYIIKEKSDYQILSNILTNMYICSRNLRSIESEIVRKKLISRSNLIEIFGGKRRNSEWKERDKEIYEFYSSIQNYARSTPFFWLQYAITSLNLGYYVDAKIYFDNAYSYASQLDRFDAFQLDTHYARFLLEEMIRCDEEFDFEKFTKAHRLLMDSSNAETRLSYVLRQVGIYSKINKKYKSEFTAEDRIKFIEDVKEVVKKFEEYFTAVEKKKKENFYFAIEKSVRKPYKNFRELLFDIISAEEIRELDRRYNHLVSKNYRVRRGNR
mgnify:CR=1 FL=1